MSKEITKTRYTARKKRERAERVVLNTLLPIPQWSKATLMSIAHDRGYRTEQAVVYVLSMELGCTMSTAKRILETGRMTWGQVMVIGALFEMTPREFCDTFMRGYFKENAAGVFVAELEDPVPLLQKPITMKSERTEK